MFSYDFICNKVDMMLSCFVLTYRMRSVMTAAKRSKKKLPRNRHGIAMRDLESPRKSPQNFHKNRQCKRAFRIWTQGEDRRKALSLFLDMSKTLVKR